MIWAMKDSATDTGWSPASEHTSLHQWVRKDNVGMIGLDVNYVSEVTSMCETFLVELIQPSVLALMYITFCISCRFWFAAFLLLLQLLQLLLQQLQLLLQHKWSCGSHIHTHTHLTPWNSPLVCCAHDALRVIHISNSVSANFDAVCTLKSSKAHLKALGLKPLTFRLTNLDPTFMQSDINTNRNSLRFSTHNNLALSHTCGESWPWLQTSWKPYLEPEEIELESETLLNVSQLWWFLL